MTQQTSHPTSTEHDRATGSGLSYMALSSATDLLTTAVAFGTGLLIARVLGPHDRGVYTLVTTIGVLAAYAVGMGVFESLLANNTQPGRKHRRAALLTGACGTLALLAFAAGTGEQGFIAYSAAPVLWCVLQISLARAALHQRASWILLRALPNAVQITFNLALWSTGHLTVVNALLAMVAGYLITLALDRVVNGRFTGPQSSLKAITTLGWKQHLLNLPRMANYRGPILVLGVLGSAEAVGLFAVASAVGSLVPTLTWSVTQNLLVLTAKGSSGAARAQRALVLTGYGSSILGAAIFAVFGADVLSLLYGATFEHTWPALVIVLAVQGMWLHSGLLQVHFRASGKTFVGATIEVLGLAAMATVMLFTESYGYMSAAYGTAASVTITLVLSLAARSLYTERTPANA